MNEHERQLRPRGLISFVFSVFVRGQC